MIQAITSNILASDTNSNEFRWSKTVCFLSVMLRHLSTYLLDFQMNAATISKCLVGITDSNMQTQRYGPEFHVLKLLVFLFPVFITFMCCILFFHPI